MQKIVVANHRDIACMKKYLLTLSMLAGMMNAQGQESPISQIQIDRPDQTECPFIVPKNHFQVESGFLIEQTDEASSCEEHHEQETGQAKKTSNHY